MAVTVVVFSVLYFTSGNLLFLKLGLLAIGILNILNGIIAVSYTHLLASFSIAFLAT